MLTSACSSIGPAAASPGAATTPPSLVSGTSAASGTPLAKASGAAGSQPGQTGSATAKSAPSDPCHQGGITYCVLNPAVTQATIDQTICVSGWTATVRPPESYTENLKEEQMAAEGLPGGLSEYEEDHRMPLELGGSPSDPMNLSPEYPASPNPKDADETAFKQEVCSGTLTLLQAQEEMVAKWLAPYPGYRTPGTQTAAPAPAQSATGSPLPTSHTPAPSATSSPTPSAPAQAYSCRASVSNLSPPQYTDETVYVTSNVPNVAGTVDAHYKTTTHPFSIQTDGSGSGQVTFDISGATVGYTVEVDVDLSGQAECSTSFTPN